MWRSKWFPIFVGILIVLPGCTGENRQKDRGDELHVGTQLPDFNPDFNPFIDTSLNEGMVSTMIYSTLFSLGYERELIPLLAEHWRTNGDKTEWVVELKKGVKFHDGSVLTAKDVAYSFDYAKAQKEGFLSKLVSSLKKTEVLSDTQIRFELDRYDDFFRYALMHLFIVKDQSFTLEKPADRNGTGPFKIQSYSPSEHKLVFEPHQGYFEGAPYLKSVTFHFLPNQMTAMAELLIGKIDLIHLIDPSYEKLFSQSAEYRMIYLLSPFYYFAEFNFANQKYQNQNVRTALNYAVPREAILAAINSVSDEAGPIYSFKQDAVTKNLFFEYDAQKALALFEKAGWSLRGSRLVDRAGRQFVINMMTMAEDEFNTSMLYYLARSLSEIGIKLVPRVVSLAQIVDSSFKSGDFETMLSPMHMRFRNVYAFEYWHSEGKIGNQGYSDGEVDRFLEKLRFSPSPEEREAAYDKFEEALVRDPPVVFLYWRKFPIIIHKRFRGFSDEPWEFTQEIKNLWVPEEEQKYR